MQIFASTLSFFISLYSLLIIIRILFSWVSLSQDQFGEFYRILQMVTDPFLNIFRSLPGLRRGSIDFSPLAALVTLGIISSILSTAARQGRITIGIILGIIVQSIWSVAAFFLMIFIILLAVRLFMEYSSSPGTSQYTSIIDSLVKWPIELAQSLFFSDSSISIRKGILGGLLLTIGIRFFGGILINFLIRLLVNLPI